MASNAAIDHRKSGESAQTSAVVHCFIGAIRLSDLQHMVKQDTKKLHGSKNALD